MSSRINGGEEELQFLACLAQTTGRRSFLKWSGVTLAVAAVGCSDSGDGLTEPRVGAEGDHITPAAPGVTVNLGTGDIGVLNYAYALEQLEAAFYIQVVGGSYYASASAEERRVLEDLRAHEVVHRDFFAAALGPNGIPGLAVDFTSVDFGSRESVLQTSRVFEDLGVSAYNGAAQLLENVDFLAVAGKIVSVEARHAAAIRSLLRPKTGFFAADVTEFGELGVVNEQGLDVVRVPAMVLPLADPFIETTIDASGLPTPEYVPATPTALVG